MGRVVDLFANPWFWILADEDIYTRMAPTAVTVINARSELIDELDSVRETSPDYYEAIKNLYDNYKWDRVTAQEQDRLAIAFNNEVGPVVDEMEARIAELEGWVDEKYAEWHRLLEELFEVETELNRGAATAR